MNEDTYQAAKNTLEKAIRDFYTQVEPEAYVHAWVVVAHRSTSELEQAGQSVVGTLVPTGQYFPTTRGLLEVALDGERT